MMELYLLKYFLAVVEKGSFTKAAASEYVTQPTLSAGIKKLESQMGHALFERTNRRVFLTEAGTRFLPRAKSILHECNMAQQEFEETESAAVLRVGLLNSISHNLVRDFLKAFQRVDHDCVLEIVDGTEQELRNRLDDRSLDYVISIMRGQPSDLMLSLYKEDYCFIVSNDHPLVSHDELQPKDLLNQEMIVRSNCELLSETSRYFTNNNVRPRLVYRTQNDSKAMAMVAAGVGAMVVPRSFVTDDVSAHQLSGFSYDRTIALYRPLYRMPDATIKASEAFESVAKSFFCDNI